MERDKKTSNSSKKSASKGNIFSKLFGSNKDKVRFKKGTRNMFFVLLWIGALSPAFALFYIFAATPEEELPSVEMLENPPELLASVVLGDDGKTELGRYWKVNRTTCNYRDISPYVFDALISTEDERYMEHSGIDFKALGRAVKSMGNDGGASTITQQLAKLLFTLQERERIAQLRATGQPIPEGPTGLKKRLGEKVKENIIAVRLEKRYTKEEIMTMYLNQFDFLHNAVGIENAARVYFNKKPIDLTKSEAAMLVGMCKNPSLYNPYTYQNKDYRSRAAIRNNVSVEAVTDVQIKEQRDEDSIRAINRKNTVLHQWLKNSNKKNPALKNFITQVEYDSLKTKSIQTDYQIVDHKQGIAPYFRESLREELTQLFEEKNEDGSLKYAKEDGSPYNIYRDGLRIYTTINVKMQKYAEDAMYRHLSEDLQPAFDKNNRKLRNYPFTNRIKDDVAEQLIWSGIKRSDRYYRADQRGLSREEIEKEFDLEVPMRVFTWQGDKDTIMTPRDSVKYYKGILRSGMVSLEPSTGFVKAWVGGINFNHFAFDHVKQGKRQVGSTIKPFVYGTALQMRAVKPCTKFTMGTSFCVDVFDGGNGQITKRWCPKGEIPENATVERGLALSNNPITVAVMSTMGGQSGPKTISKLLKSLEIDLRPEDEVPSMCLGVMDLSVLQMTAAQAMFVNNGIYVRPTTVLRIEDRNGNVIYNADPYSKEVMSANVAFATLTMMKGVVNYGTSTSLKWHPKWGGIKHPMAGKTGTTQNNSDGWFMGLTPDLVTGVWCGAEDRASRFKSMTWGQGARMSLPIYGYYMKKVYADRSLKISTEEFEMPIGYDPEEFSCSGDVETNNPGDILGI